MIVKPGLIRINLVYMIAMCTWPVRMSKTPLSSELTIHDLKVRKSHFVPFEPIEWLKNLHMARKDLELGKCILKSLFVSCPSIIAKYNCVRAEKSFANL